MGGSGADGAHNEDGQHRQEDRSAAVYFQMVIDSRKRIQELDIHQALYVEKTSMPKAPVMIDALTARLHAGSVV